jgi:hypothetical protein
MRALCPHPHRRLRRRAPVDARAGHVLGVGDLHGQPGGAVALFKVMANMAGLVMAIAGVQILLVNRRFLPRALRAPLYREALLAACVCFHGFFALRAMMHGVW